MSLNPTVMKFGGTSLADRRAFERVARIVRERRTARTVVVVSAMSRVTDALLEGARLAARRGADAAEPLIAEHLERHAEVARALLSADACAAVEAAVERSRADLARLLRSVASEPSAAARLQDEIVSHGEQLSALLLSTLLGDRGRAARYVDARRCIVTDDSHGCASPRHDATARRTRDTLLPVLDSAEVPVLGGFIAATAEGVTTTLGRNGSDYTAALVAAALSAAELQIWTDVTGVHTADPRVIAGARTVAHLTYAEAETLARSGAKVLHPKTIRPVAELGIPVRIICSYAPEEASTLVSAARPARRGAAKAIAYQKGVSVVRVRGSGRRGAADTAAALSALLETHHGEANVIADSGEGVMLAFADESLAHVREDLERLGAVTLGTGRAVVCVVGAGGPSTRQVAERARAVLRPLEVALVTTDASGGNLFLVLDPARVAEAVARLHAAFFERVEDEREAEHAREPETAASLPG